VAICAIEIASHSFAMTSINGSRLNATCYKIMGPVPAILHLGYPPTVGSVNVLFPGFRLILVNPWDICKSQGQ